MNAAPSTEADLPLHWNHPGHWLAKAAAIFCIAFALRLGFFFLMHGMNIAKGGERIPPLPYNIDGYEQIASNLLAGHGFSSDYNPGTKAIYRPNLSRSPAYPLLLAELKYFFGEIRAPIFYAQAMMGAVTALLVFGLARRFWGTRAAWWAGLLAACDPASVIWLVYPRAEAMLTMLALAGFCLLVAGGERLRRGEDEAGCAFVIGAGLACALAALTKPMALWLVLVAMGLLFWSCRRPRAACAGSAWMLAIWLAMCGGWVWRNYLVTRAASKDGRGMFFFSTSAADNLLVYRAAQVEALASHRPLHRVVGELRTKVHTATQSPNRSIEHANEWTVRDVKGYEREAWRIVAAHPFLALRVKAEGAARVLLGPGDLATLSLFGIGLSSGELNTLERRGWEASAAAAIQNAEVLKQDLFARDLVRAFSWGWLAFIYIPAAAGVWRLGCARQWLPLGMLLAGIGYFVFWAGGPEESSRFRVPMIPYVALLAGCGLGGRWTEADRGLTGARR